MAAQRALSDHQVLFNVLHQLSSQTYKVRRQLGPDQPVEFLEFRPTLVPSILVNKLWAEEGTSILWQNYPHLPALATIDTQRRQHYASKVRKLYVESPPLDHPDTLDYLQGLEWPALKYLELEVDFSRHGSHIHNMLHTGLEHLEFTGFQGGGADAFRDSALPALFNSCKHLRGIRFGPGIVNDDDLLHSTVLQQHLQEIPTITNVEIKTGRFIDKDDLFLYLSQKSFLEGLEIDLDPGLILLSKLDPPTGLHDSFQFFPALKRLTIMCYPEIALALPFHLNSLEYIQLDVCRIPEQPVQDSDFTIIDDLLTQLSHCTYLKHLKIGVGALAESFPSSMAQPILSGSTLTTFAQKCPNLMRLYIFAVEPSALDATQLHDESFETFCSHVPLLEELSLKLHPPTATQLYATALQSLSKHCQMLQLLRLKIPFDLTSLPTSSPVPILRVTNPDIVEEEAVAGAAQPVAFDTIIDSGAGSTINEALSQQDIPLFPRLTHLAIARPQNALALDPNLSYVTTFDPTDPDLPTDIHITSIDSSTTAPQTVLSSSVIDPAHEEDLVRSWAHPLKTHFPALEILEAWGDWIGGDNESLNYFLPVEEVLATSWEFLSGAEQDLWHDEELDFDGGDERTWVDYEDGKDLEETVYDYDHFQDGHMRVDSESLSDSQGTLNDIEEVSEGQLTPGPTPGKDFATEVSTKGEATSRIPYEELNELQVSS